MDLRTRTRCADGGSAAAALVASAARLRWRAPELALLMADQASSAAARQDAEAVRLRAEVLAVFACNQLGRGAETGGRAMRALRAAIEAGEEVTERLIRVELAACAADASAPSVGLTVLQPVFGRGLAVAPTVRAAAMVTAADCLARLGGGPDVAALLTAADQLYDTSRAVEPDAVLLRRGVVHARLAAYHRRCGDHRSAESAALAGLALVAELTDGELDTGQVSGWLTLELVSALLDSDRAAEAVLAAQPVLRRAARPAGAPAACWLRLALVSRVQLPAGRHALARRLLAEAAGDAERNHLDAVLAECRQLQTQVHETCEEIREALHSLRTAHVAERRWRDTAAELRTLLAAEFGQPEPAAQLRAAVGAVLAGYRAAALPPATVARNGRPVRPVRTRHSAPATLPVPVVAHSAIPLGGAESGEAEAPRARPPSAWLTAVSAPEPDRPERQPDAEADAGGDQTPPSGFALVALEQLGQAAARWRSMNEVPAAATTGVYDAALPASPEDPHGHHTNGAAVIDLVARSFSPAADREPTGPTVAEPAPADPATSGAAPPGPAVPEAAVPNPVVSNPVVSNPAVAGPGESGPGESGPGRLDLGRFDTTASGPARSERALFDPALPDSGPGVPDAWATSAQSGVVTVDDTASGQRAGDSQPYAGAAEAGPPEEDGSATGTTPDEPRTQPIPILALPAEPPVPVSHRRQAQGGTSHDEPDPAQRQDRGTAQPRDHAGQPLLTTTNGIDRGSGRHRSDMAMADLLAEALFAYHNGRQSQLVGGVAGESPAGAVAVNGHHRRPGSPDERPGGGDDVETPPMGLALPTAVASNSQVRWADLPSELVWREPGWERRH